MVGKIVGQGALVTGSSRGIGAAIAKGLADKGAAVVVNYATDETGANKVSEEIRSLGGTAHVLQADLAVREEAEALVAAAEERLGHLDILVMNHGVTPRANLGDLSDKAIEIWERNLQVNLVGTFYCVNATIALMKRRKYGRIICISSECAHRGCAGGAAYSASKAGIHGLVHAAARELAALDITVNAVSPGLTETSMTTSLFSATLKKQLIARIPKGRFATPKEIAEAVVFLASPSARYITGQIIGVNGGSYMSQ